LEKKLFKKNLLFLIFFTAVNNGYAQANLSEYQKNCTQEQYEEHKNSKNKSLKEAEFNSFCTCVANYISKNASTSQINEIAIDPKARPEWLKVVEVKAYKKCLKSDEKN
jgi:hypothetical protein